MKKRLLSALLALAMVLTLLPVSAFAAGEDAWNGGVYEWYYAQLDDTQKAMYEFLKENLKPEQDNAKPDVDWHVQCLLSGDMTRVGNDASKMQEWVKSFYKAYHALERDHPEWPWLSANTYALNTLDDKINNAGVYQDPDNGEYYWKENTWFILGNPMTDVCNYSNEFETAINTAETAIGPQNNDYEQAKAIHDYLCELITYGSDSNQYVPCDETAFYALTGSPTVGEPNDNIVTSEGYAAAFKLLCDRFHIPCVRVSGSLGKRADETTHGWNLILLDGLWYGVDCLGDDLGNSASHDCFAVGGNTQIGGAAFSAGHDVVNEWTKDTLSRFTISLPLGPSMSSAAYGEEPADTAAETATKLAASVNTVPYGDSVILTATVTSGGTNVTGGAVIFSRQTGGEAVGLGESRVQNGTAKFTLEEKYPVGSYSFTAKYVPDGAGYMESSSAPVSVSVERKVVNITGVKAVDRPYDGTGNVTLTGGELAGTVSGDAVSVEVPTAGTIDTFDASSTPYDVKIALPELKGADAGSYTLAQLIGIKVTITQADPVVGEVSVDGKVYPTTKASDVALKRDGADLTEGSIALDPSVTLKAGTGSYPWTFTPTDSTNYKTVKGAVSINVLSRDLTGITSMARRSTPPA